MRLANERRRYTVTPSLIGWAHTQNDQRTCGIWSTFPIATLYAISFHNQSCYNGNRLHQDSSCASFVTWWPRPLTVTQKHLGVSQHSLAGQTPSCHSARMIIDVIRTKIYANQTWNRLPLTAPWAEFSGPELYLKFYRCFSRLSTYR